MKKYMIITTVDGEQSATFTDDSAKAERIRQFGAYAEVYAFECQYDEEGTPIGAGYVLIYS